MLQIIKPQENWLNYQIVISKEIKTTDPNININPSLNMIGHIDRPTTLKKREVIKGRRGASLNHNNLCFDEQIMLHPQVNHMYPRLDLCSAVAGSMISYYPMITVNSTRNINVDK
jgi:hypothetical protein